MRRLMVERFAPTDAGRWRWIITHSQSVFCDSMTRKVQTTLGLWAVLGLGVLGSAYTSCQWYMAARQVRLVKEAREYLAKPDTHKAMLCLRLALRHNNRDTEACRLMAELAEMERSPAALLWRSRLVELNPGSTDDRLALARSAMIACDYHTATNALDGVAATGKATAAFHSLAGAVAGTMSQPALAEAHFLEAARLEPHNAFLQMNLAMVRLHGTNTPLHAEARRSLQQIAANPTNSNLRCQALRELISESLRAKNWEAALASSRQLLQETNAVFSDRLRQLDALRESKSTEFKQALADLELEASTEPGKIAELANWQMMNTTLPETLAWLRALPASTQTNLAIVMITAEVYTALHDWPGLQADVESQSWGELQFLQHAYIARALRGQEFPGAATGGWKLAVEAANDNLASLGMLLKLTTTWQWQSEEEDILWRIVNRYPAERWAFAALSRTLHAGGQTRALMMLYRQELKRSPENLGAKNNLAMTAFLQQAIELKPHDLAREVYEKAPTNSAFVSTYAFSLHLQNKDAEALKIFQTLEEEQLEDPRIAGYYGLVLNATGDKATARGYLDSAFKRPMLPEEQELFKRAAAGI